jgi:hypothetical protein
MEGDNFFTLDEVDVVVFSRLMRSSPDFGKLDKRDQTMLIWFIIKYPKGIQSFIDYLGKQYKEISASNLFKDVEAIP